MRLRSRNDRHRLLHHRFHHRFHRRFHHRFHRRRHRRGAALAACAVLATTTVACEVHGGDVGGGGGAYPDGTIEFTAPSSPGASTDLIARAVSREVADALGVPTTVVNQAGANGKLGGVNVFGSAPDGYRVALMPQSLFSIGPLVIDDPNPIEVEDMTVVRGVSREDYVLVSVPGRYDGLDEALEVDRLVYGTTGVGTGSELAQALLYGSADVHAADVPFDGAAPLLTAILGGDVDLGAMHVAEAAEQVNAGELEALAVFTEERTDAFPDTPTAAELGHEVVVDQRRFVAAPPDLPEEVREVLSDAIGEAVSSAEVSQSLEASHVEVWNVDGDEVAAELTASRERYAALAREFGVDLGVS